MNSPTRFPQPGSPRPHAMRLSLLGLRPQHTRRGAERDVHRGRSRRGGQSRSSGRGLSRGWLGAWSLAGGRRATAPPWLGGELHQLKNPRRRAAAGVEGTSSSGRGGHLGAPRGPDVPEGTSRALGCGCGAGRRWGARIPRDLGHPGRRRGPVTLRDFWWTKAGSRCVSKQSPPQLLSARIQPPSCGHRKDYLDEEGICP